MTSIERAELLVRVDERTEKIEKWSENHMAHHQKLFGFFVTACISVILAQATTVAGLIVAMCQKAPR